MEVDVSLGGWPRAIFVEKPELFLPFLEEGRERAEEEAKTLAKIMKDRGVGEGGRVLDLGCGVGRHSVPLARQGYRVLGVDLSPEFIRRAREYARAQDVAESILFHVGDMRQIASVLEGQDRFNATINMWTSLGYYGEDVDREVLRQVVAFTAEGGLLLVEMANKDGIMRVFQNRGWGEAGDIVSLETRRFDPERSHMVNAWTFYRRKGDDLTFLAREQIDHRLYASHELGELVESAGWNVEGVYGGLGLEPLDPGSPGTRMVLVARRGEP